MKLLQHWTITDLPSGVQISRSLYIKLSSLIKDHLAINDTNREKASRLFRSLYSEETHSEERLNLLVSQWIMLSDFFHGIAHDSRGKRTEVNLDDVKRKFQIFEATLEGFVSSDQARREINELLEKANS